jgi:hypothetical protein
VECPVSCSTKKVLLICKGEPYLSHQANLHYSLSRISSLSFSGYKRFTPQMIIAHMVNILNRDPELVSFTKYDPRGTGFISADDLSGVLKGWNVILTPKQVKWIYTLFDHYKTGNLDYKLFAERILDDRDTSKLGVQKSASSKAGDDALKRRIKQKFNSVREAFRHYDGYVRMVPFLFYHMYMCVS